MRLVKRSQALLGSNLTRDSKERKNRARADAAWAFLLR